MACARRKPARILLALSRNLSAAQPFLQALNLARRMRRIDLCIGTLISEKLFL